MSDFMERIGKLSPKRLALLAVELNDQLEAGAQRATEPVAVVGMGCRFPGGADDPASFWELLRDGRDAIREVPADRWDIDAFYDPDPDAPSTMSARCGGFLDRVDGFDAAFFGVSPREALTMDPQQRLLLEVSWEALEHAGIAPESLAGSTTGVYVGVCNGDHFQRVLQRGSDSIDAYIASGNAHSVAAGRISYFLGLQGPALSIDTACSSSLVALHVACQSLRSGETRLALAGGVNVMCSPETTIALTKAHMLAPDGRCKTFDAAADGFSRGEGCGVLVLKRISDALADGDRILALIRGTAANQDGRSGGLTVPNGPSQEAVIRAALAQARLQPADIDYVEAHGTGTTLGDPIEVRALAGALGAGRPQDAPLLIGSVKTNFGHLESAAGIAGVIKVILSLVHERIPPHLHFREPSRQIAWSEYPIAVAAAGQGWTRGGRCRRAGVSSFGFSGTNAHVIVEEAPAASETPVVVERPVHCYPLSARSDGALRRLASGHAAALAPLDAAGFRHAAHTVGVGRSHLSERVAVAAASAEEVATALAAFGRDEPHPALHRGAAEPGRPLEVVFLFTGQGAQYPGMSRALYDGSPVFREVIDRCDALLGADAAGWTLKSVLWPRTQESPIHDTAWTQPALFAVEYALAQLWRSWGIEPAAVIGHSVGEYAAACVAGVFTLEEGLKLIAARGRLMQALPAGGAMAAVFASVAEIEQELASFAGLSIAAINAPDSVVVSGDAVAIDGLLAKLARRDIQGQRLLVSLAAHSPLVDPALDAMQACAAAVTMRAPRIPIAWNLTGGDLPHGTAPDATYWRRHLREPVRFADGVARMHRDGYRVFLEVGPHPTLLALAQRSLPEGEAVWLTSLRRGRDDWQEMSHSLCELYVRGAAVDWAGYDHGYSRRRLSLPTYPFERQSFWIEPVRPQAFRSSLSLPRGRRLPGQRLPIAVPTFETSLASDSLPYLAEHRLRGEVIAAGPVFLELAQAAAREASGAVAPAIESFVIHEPLRLSSRRVVQTQLTSLPDGAKSFAVHSRAAGDAGDAGDWLLHASGRLADTGDAQQRDDVGDAADAADAAIAVAGEPVSASDFYRKLERLGIDLGPRYRVLRDVRHGRGQALVTIEAGAGCADDPTVWAHPALLDGAFQAVGLAVGLMLPADDERAVYLLSQVASIQLAGPLPARFRCHARLRDAASASPREWLADLTLHAVDGALLGRLRGVSLRRADLGAAGEAHAAPSVSFYRTEWEALPAPAAVAADLRSPAAFAPETCKAFESLAARHGLVVYDELLPALDRLSREHVVAALRQLGFEASAGRVFDASDEAEILGVAPRHARLFRRLLDILCEDGVLVRHGAQYQVPATPAAETAPGESCDALLARFGEVDGELRMLRRCAGELAPVLRGELDPLQLLFPGGAFDEARKLYVDSPYARTYNGALVEALRAAIAQLPPDGRLRVLEIGAGTGGTTSFVLPHLPADRVDYTFTDLSPLFLERAAERFAGFSFLATALLDIERDPLAQGFRQGAFDIVIAANVLHATADLASSLRHIRALLAPQGLLCLLEGVAPERWVDLTFGLTEGWWRFSDHGLRADYPLLGRDRWLELLARSGYEDGLAIPGDGEGRARSQQALLIARAPCRRRSWALVDDEGGVAAELAVRLASRDEPVVTLSASSVPEMLEADVVVFLAALDLADLSVDDPGALAASGSLAGSMPLAMLGDLARHGFRGQVWLVTRGVHGQGGAADGDGIAAGAQWQAPLWGVGRVFALEHPEAWGGLIDLPAGGSPAMLANLLLDAIDNDDGEDQVACRPGQRQVLRLAQAPQDEVADDGLGPRFRADATYLVTGGYGGLGLVVARWMAQQGARHLALLGRHPNADADGVRAIEALGARVHPLQGDVADETALTALLARLAAQAPPLRGVMHAAADLSEAAIVDLAPADVAAMLRPKLQGAVLLERLTRNADLDFLVLFSTSTALLGAAGLAHYAAANAFLDAFARRADRPARRVVSINWGIWEVMRLASEQQQRAYRQAGLHPMPTGRALAALGRALRSDQANPMVASIDWHALRALHESRRRRPMLARLGHVDETMAPVAPVADDVRTAPDIVARFAQTPPEARRDLMLDFVSREVAVVLGLEPGRPVAARTGLFDLGMDSLMSVELKSRLERGTGRRLPPTLTFNYPNVAALATFLANLLAAAVEPAPAPAAGSAAGPAASSEGVSAATAATHADEVDLDELSDDELESRLLARLEQAP